MLEEAEPTASPTGHGALRPGRDPSSTGLTAAPRDWARLFARTRIEDALDEIAGWLGPVGSFELAFGAAPDTGPSLHAGWRLCGPDAGASVTRVLSGPRAGSLTVRGTAAAEALEEALGVAAVALEAWRAARDEAARAESRLQARTVELDLLQDLGRAAAEARTPEGLWSGVSSVLHRSGDDDAIVVAHAATGRREIVVYLARPVSEAGVRDLARAAGAVLTDAGTDPTRVRVERLDRYDAHRGARGPASSSELVVLPVLRRGSAVAALAVLPAGEPRESRMRVLFGAVNQIAVHLDRILTVREAEEGRFRAMLETMPQAVLLTDRELDVVRANPAARRLLDGPLAASGGRRLARLGSLDVAGRRHETEAGPVLAEARLEGGHVLDVSLSALGGEGYVLVLSDVTEKRRLQERLTQSEKLSSLGELISGIAHELNNPLASVLGYAQLAQAATHDARLAERLDVIHREARRCQRTVQGLLAFARRHEPERRPLSLNETVDSVLALLAYPLRVAGIRAERALDAELPPVHGDPHLLQQALLNLVSNAHHALREHGGTIVLRTRLETGGQAVLEIEDDGPGIPACDRARIFDPFFTTKSPGQGTGLGLSIVYGIVTSHAGTIEVDAAAGGGALFRIRLPLGEPHRRAPRPPAPADSIPAVTGRILVVDDEAALACLVAEALADDGHQTAAVGGRDAALLRLRDEPFDLVICDLKMPGMGAADFRRELDRLRPGLGGRVLLVSGDTLSREPEAIAEREGWPLLHKPFDLVDLRRVVAGQLARGRGACGT